SPCLDHKCQNGGLCVEAPNDNYTCVCPEGFEGSFCEGEKTEGGGGDSGLETKWIIVIAVLSSVAAAAIIIAITFFVCWRSAKHKTMNSEQTNLQMESTTETTNSQSHLCDTT
ncbi:hypothetical protein CRUP_013664, partial [Coryphaenoides rupestris]